MACLYPLVALPVAFLVTAGIGMALERTIIRHLYGRPLETLLATGDQPDAYPAGEDAVWRAERGGGKPGLALRRRAGPAEPDPAVEPAGGAGVRPAGAVFYLAHPEPYPSGDERPRRDAELAMAACCGVPTGRVDMLAFGLGSGIAGLGGVALSQLGNVGPELGQGYIIDSFLVVVLGGVGQLAGSVAAAFGLGIFNKILEPQMGAVLGKILILVMIILFIQKRPQGLFALKGRVID